MGMLQKPYFQMSGMCSALTTAQCLWQSQALAASELYRTLLAHVLTQQHQQQVWCLKTSAFVCSLTLLTRLSTSCILSVIN